MKILRSYILYDLLLCYRTFGSISTDFLQKAAPDIEWCGGERLVNPCELTASVTALANALACRLNDEELGLLGAVLTQLGDTLATIAVQRGICASRK